MLFLKAPWGIDSIFLRRYYPYQVIGSKTFVLSQPTVPSAPLILYSIFFDRRRSYLFLSCVEVICNIGVGIIVVGRNVTDAEIKLREKLGIHHHVCLIAFKAGRVEL